MDDMTNEDLLDAYENAVGVHDGAGTRTETKAASNLAERRAAVLARMEQGWRPIAEAPRDGTDFLALIPFQAKHHQMVGCFAPDGQFHSWPSRLVYSPSHYKPLDAAPATPERSDHA